MNSAVMTLLLATAGLGGNAGHEPGTKFRPLRNYFSAEPQTCYAPHFGCYPGNNRHMHRYPAFHGVYYRKAYNYRNVFDYPWHAGLHEPSSLFSYGVDQETVLDYEEQIYPPQPPVEDVQPTEGLPDYEARRTQGIPRRIQARQDERKESSKKRGKQT